jgi:hypothetical protein
MYWDYSIFICALIRRKTLLSRASAFVIFSDFLTPYSTVRASLIYHMLHLSITYVMYRLNCFLISGLHRLYMCIYVYVCMCVCAYIPVYVQTALILCCIVFIYIPPYISQWEYARMTKRWYEHLIYEVAEKGDTEPLLRLHPMSAGKHTLA